MSWQNWLQLAALVGLVLLSTPLLGRYLARVLDAGAVHSTSDARGFACAERATLC
jgi:hypothetical protein